MNFWQVFVRVFPWRPWSAASAMWWHLTGRRVRARNQLRAAGGDLPFAYNLWIRNVEEAQQAEASTDLHDWSRGPHFSIVIDARGRSNDALDRSIRSVSAQQYPNWSVVVVGAETNDRACGGPAITVVDHWRDALRESGDFIVPVVVGDQLSEWALFYFADAIANNPDALLVYGDEDHIDTGGDRRRPFFKPRWNKELQLAMDYVSRSCALKATAIRYGTSATHGSHSAEVLSLILELTNEPRFRAAHVPRIVNHRWALQSEAEPGGAVDAVARHVAPAGATVSAGPFGTVKVSWPLPAELPLVSIIIPTKDKADLLRACVDSVLTRTDYARFELLVIDNHSVESRTFEYLDTLSSRPNIRVLSYPGAYNYSAINNFAAGAAAGTFICLLNNDTEVVSPEWLTEMMRYAARSDVGAVGAKLLYPDGTIQHAGVIVGIGDAAGHPHRNLPSDVPGYFKQAHVAQYVSAVTGACLLVDKRKYLAVGGLDEESLPIAYNDVDLCLKLERAGWHNVYVPHAVLLHHESKSRAKDHSRGRVEAYKRELRAFQERWGADRYDDPLMNPNLDRSSETFVIRF